MNAVVQFIEEIDTEREGAGSNAVLRRSVTATVGCVVSVDVYRTAMWYVALVRALSSAHV